MLPALAVMGALRLTILKKYEGCWAVFSPRRATLGSVVTFLDKIQMKLCGKNACKRKNTCVYESSRGGSSSVGRAPGCGPGGRGFKSHLSPHNFPAPQRRGFFFGAWRSLVAHLLWEQEVEGSNPFAPTKYPRKRDS